MKFGVGSKKGLVLRFSWGGGGSIRGQGRGRRPGGKLSSLNNKNVGLLIYNGNGSNGDHSEGGALRKDKSITDLKEYLV